MTKPLVGSTSKTERRLTHAGMAAVLFLLPALSMAQALPVPHFTTLHVFTGPPDGQYPTGSNLTKDAQGNLYGSTIFGGNTQVCGSGCGLVFKINAAGKETILYAFTGAADGAVPNGVIRDGAGNLYGTAEYGGDHTGICSQVPGCGVVFKLDTTGKETVLHTFTSGGAGGLLPSGGLVRDAQGNLYGVTGYGGNMSDCSGYGCGVVFKLDTTGKETVLYRFTGGSDGGAPTQSLARDSAGNLYGNATAGGDAHCQCGNVFKLDTTGKETVLHNFTGGIDGGYPQSGLVLDGAGNLYGTTYQGGNVYAGGCGVVYKLSKTGGETVLYSFAGGPDGCRGASFSTLVRDTSGNLYGATGFGGDSSCRPQNGGGCGVVFELTRAGKYTVLYTFTGGADGNWPMSGLLRDATTGTLYGSAQQGGNNTDCSGSGCGTVFRLSP